jgi:heparosan-N-sulfate-glucuronate 5-epimerase
MRKKLKLTENINLGNGFLGRYYFDFSGILNPAWPFDEKGVRLRPYPPPLFYQYHPMAIAEYALDCHRLYLETGEEHYKIACINNADWFVKNIRTINNEFGIWFYDFRESLAYNVPQQFRSSMSQGYGISLLLRAYEITKDDSYLKPVYAALNSYRYSVSDGGICNVYKGYVFYEEAPSVPPSCILNGFIFALLGLYDFLRLFDNTEDRKLYDEGIATLENCLQYYDLGYWSRYHLQYDKYLASTYYHDIHIIQLYLLYRITGSETFLNYSNKWQSYKESKRCLFRYFTDFYMNRYLYKIQRTISFFKSL